MKKLIGVVLIALLIDTPVAWPATHSIYHHTSITKHHSIYKSANHSYSNKGWKKQHKKH
jgi:cephalosporin-C deacetylase-like acetyl esterase